jgi:hypothetical protein
MGFLHDLKAFMVFHDLLSSHTGMTGNDGEEVLPSTECGVFVEGQIYAAAAERVCALAQKGHTLRFGDVILHGLSQAFIRPAKKDLILSQSFLPHDRASVCRIRATCKPGAHGVVGDR